MNIIFFLLAVILTASHAFQWEFDMGQCLRTYECFVPKDIKDAPNGTLIRLDDRGAYHRKMSRFDYVQHPHVVAIKAQSNNRWSVVMQSRLNQSGLVLEQASYIKRAFNARYGMILFRPSASGTAKPLFLACVEHNGTARVASSEHFETELIDSYFDDNHLFCDYNVRAKSGSGKVLTGIVSKTDKFGLIISIEEKMKFFMDDCDHEKYRYGFYGKEDKFIAPIIHNHANHGCRLSQMKYDPTEARKWGKVRPPQDIEQEIKCTDDRYQLYVTDSKGRTRDNAHVECINGQYRIRYWDFMHHDEIFLESDETFNAVCYVQDNYICPLTVPCEHEFCPFVVVTMNTARKTRPPEYEIKCEGGRTLKIGKHRFDSGIGASCWNHELFIYKGRRSFGLAGAYCGW